MFFQMPVDRLRNLVCLCQRILPGLVDRIVPKNPVGGDCHRNGQQKQSDETTRYQPAGEAGPNIEIKHGEVHES